MPLHSEVHSCILTQQLSPWQQNTRKISLFARDWMHDRACHSTNGGLHLPSQRKAGIEFNAGRQKTPHNSKQNRGSNQICVKQGAGVLLFIANRLQPPACAQAL